MCIRDSCCGVATSATDRRRWMQGDSLRHHIIDPHTGRSAESDVVSVTIVAPTAVEAETAAKSVLIRGSVEGLDWLEDVYKRQFIDQCIPFSWIFNRQAHNRLRHFLRAG